MPQQPFSARSHLLERDAELAALEALSDATQAGGHLLALEGPPGIGKTALIAQAKSSGQAAGMQVLGARGSELEHTFSYGVVRQLFEPFLASLPEQERAELLGDAAGLAAPLFDPAELAASPAADSSLATLHGLYWLTANVAARARLLLAIDDLHWCDLLSLRWLAYLLPRMEGLDAWVVVGLRPEEPGADPGLVAQLLSDPLATIVQPAPLSPEATARLLRETASSSIVNPNQPVGIAEAEGQTGEEPAATCEKDRPLAATCFAVVRDRHKHPPAGSLVHTPLDRASPARYSSRWLLPPVAAA